jgi:hypothetical protein
MRLMPIKEWETSLAEEREQEKKLVFLKKFINTRCVYSAPRHRAR